MFQIFFYKNRAVYEIMWKNMIQRGQDKNMQWPICIACYVTKATDKHSEYITIIALPLQQFLSERDSILHKNV